MEKSVPNIQYKLYQKLINHQKKILIIIITRKITLQKNFNTLHLNKFHIKAHSSVKPHKTFNIQNWKIDWDLWRLNGFTSTFSANLDFIVENINKQVGTDCSTDNFLYIFQNSFSLFICVNFVPINFGFNKDFGSKYKWKT